MDSPRREECFWRHSSIGRCLLSRLRWRGEKDSVELLAHSLSRGGPSSEEQWKVVETLPLNEEELPLRARSCARSRACSASCRRVVDHSSIRIFFIGERKRNLGNAQSGDPLSIRGLVLGTHVFDVLGTLHLKGRQLEKRTFSSFPSLTLIEMPNSEGALYFFFQSMAE